MRLAMIKTDELLEIEGWTYDNRQCQVQFDEDRVQAFISLARKDLASEWEFSVVISNDSAVREANRKYRKVDRATDVLSFPSGEGRPYTRSGGYIGDLLISAARAAEQAEQHEHSVTDEIQVLALHGLLHLIGFDHEKDSGEMLEFETVLRRKYGLPAGLTERTSQ